MSLGWRHMAAAVAALLCVSVQVPAWSQVLSPEARTGSHVPMNPQVVAGMARGELISEFAKCIFRQYPDRVDYFLRHSDDLKLDPSIKDIRRYLGLSYCLGDAADDQAIAVSGVFHVQSLRDMLAEESYRQANPTMPAVIPAPTTVSRVFFTPPEERGAAQARAEFADCIVEKDKAGADAILRTRRGSLEEKASARALAPVLGVCLLTGQKLALKVENVREFAANGLWQYFEAAKPVRYKGMP